MVKCPECRGLEKVPMEPEAELPCPVCGAVFACARRGWKTAYLDCERCNGSGEVHSSQPAKLHGKNVGDSVTAGSTAMRTSKRLTTRSWQPITSSPRPCSASTSSSRTPATPQRRTRCVTSRSAGRPISQPLATQMRRPVESSRRSWTSRSSCVAFADDRRAARFLASRRCWLT